MRRMMESEVKDLNRSESKKYCGVRFLVMDVDGTLTDGKIYMGNEGEIFKAFHVRDGYGIKQIAMPGGIIPVIITARDSRIVTERCRELDINEVYQNCSNKVAALKEILERYSEKPEAVAFIGDDLADLDCMRYVRESGGVTGCPDDAVAEIRDAADFVAQSKGGEGAVREFIDWLVKQSE